ncbi:hypothetical protein [Streptomyces noursei]|uniref:hypothetical protein n=1 Tax=Streptomyces noursei TaxID=1971 RepID=UPI0016723935|nr:hypothetical protein [Streptomyces noursei]MCZ1014807.1 hypothetical protein [Streptomyces noursei]GGW97790.1 hypothetical protein GCM10010341_19170 [Streptomyces noursei]
MGPSHQHAVHQLLTEAHNDLAARHDEPVPKIHDLLAETAIDLYDHDQFGDHPLSIGRIVDEAAACLLNLATPQRLALPHDEDLPGRLGELDRLPLADRTRLLKGAASRTAPAQRQPPRDAT